MDPRDRAPPRSQNPALVAASLDEGARATTPVEAAHVAAARHARSCGSCTAGNAATVEGERLVGEASRVHGNPGHGSSLARTTAPGKGGGTASAAQLPAKTEAGVTAEPTCGRDEIASSFAGFQSTLLMAAASAASAAVGDDGQRPRARPRSHGQHGKRCSRHRPRCRHRGHGNNFQSQDALTADPGPIERSDGTSSHRRRARLQDSRRVPNAGAAVTRATTSGRSATMAARQGSKHPACFGGIPSVTKRPSSVSPTRGLLPSTHQLHSQQVKLQLPRAPHCELRLPPSDERAVLRRLTAASTAVVVAHNLPPPPTSSDARSGASASDGSRRSDASSRSPPRRSATTGPAPAAPPMVASVRLARGGTVDAVGPSAGPRAPFPPGRARPPPAAAMHVTMDDPILRKKMVLDHRNSPNLYQKPSSSASSAVFGADAATAGKPSGFLARGHRATSGKQRVKSTSRATLRGRGEREAAALGGGSTESTKGSDSDGGYVASSERRSGYGSESAESETSSKGSNGARGGVPATRGSPAAEMDETSSMSSSVLAEFTPGFNDDVTILLSSSDTSLSSHGRHRGRRGTKARGTNYEEGVMGDAGRTATTNASSHSAQAAKRSSPKRDSTCFLRASINNNACKRCRQGATQSWIQNKATKKSLAEQAADGYGSTSPVSDLSFSKNLPPPNVFHHQTHGSNKKSLERSFWSAKHDLSTSDTAAVLSMLDVARKPTGDHPLGKTDESLAMSTHKASIYLLGQDCMAQVVLFLESPEIHTFLTAPLSKTWLARYAVPQELWKILCTSKPFCAKLDKSVSGSGHSDVSLCSSSTSNEPDMLHLFGRYRLLYTSFVRCMKYLHRLQDDALNGRTPSPYGNGRKGDLYPHCTNASPRAYFAKAQQLVHRRTSGSLNGSGETEACRRSNSNVKLSITSKNGTHCIDNHKNNIQKPRQKYGQSMLTNRLFRLTHAGNVGSVNLPWSCAIYSVVNWMVTFVDVEGIQIMCLKCLPFLLEDESHRTTAQRAGLTDSVLRAMVLFPDSIELHTVAFHTLVLLARPLGGNEGMLFHTSMVNTRGIFNGGNSSNSKNGIVIMLDSMRRFAHDEILQAMSCWSLVNVALAPLQKSIFVKLGGLTVTSNAMLQHPYNAEVQFRALFALINLVIPTEARPDEFEKMRALEFQQIGEVAETSEKEMLDASVGQISSLVVQVMKNFCSSEAILNRASLVLHNLSLNVDYHTILLWTPNCYQMLEWCLGNYPHDHVLQQSAGGTIQRLNATLSLDEELRTRFRNSVSVQQQHFLELARQEAVALEEQHQEQVE